MDTYFDVNKVLPENIGYKWASIHLYRIGLDLFETPYNCGHRLWFYKPILAFITFTIFYTNRILCLVYDTEYVSTMLGDFGYFIGARQSLNLHFVFLAMSSMGIQIIYFY